MSRWSRLWGGAPARDALDAAAVLEALDGAQAICGLDGAVLAANTSWRTRLGPARRIAGASAFGAFNAARRDGRGEGVVRVAGEERHLAVTAMAEDRFLLTVSIPSEGPRAPPGPERLDAFAADLPFGAALIEGADPFDGLIVEVNAALAGVAGKEATVGARLADLLTPASLAEARARLAEGGRGAIEVAPAATPERAAHLYLAAGADRSVFYLQDVTEQARLQSQLDQRNKMEAIGQLAGGVAHDFNNLLTAIRLRADELLLRHALGDPSYDSLAEIRQTVERAAELVRQLLSFSRKATVRRESLDLGEALDNFAVLLRRLVREDVVLTVEHGPDLPRVRMDRSALENAIINLVLNARDALQAKGGGAIRVRAARLTAAEATALECPARPGGDVALIEVADDGPGIPLSILPNIFEPFFTTKAVGEGTGLGLATVYGIVKQADGWIVAVSPPGQGAAFRVFLPAHIPPIVLETQAPAAPARRAARDLSGAGRILFVEDEAGVRGVAARLLRARGYEVLEAADGEEALELARAHAGRIDLMISDVIMPFMDGPSLLRAARPYLGAAPVMFISGYAEADFSNLLEGETGVSFLPKPLDIKTLAERVRAELRPAEPG